MTEIEARPLTAEAFAQFGDVLDCSGSYDMLINDGLCERHHDRAALDFGPEIGDGRAGVSLFRAQPRTLPYELRLIERHPEGSQCFIPMTQNPFLVIVADNPGTRPLAFLTTPGQAINFHRGTWHGVLTPLNAPGDLVGLFAVIDRIGQTPNLEEHVFETPYLITRNGLP
ncbi:MAG: ureidoglycolate lyase [Pseudomonadota bacterium]